MRLTVYGRSHCHLCEEMLSALRPFQERYGFALEVVDIDGEPQLEARYGAKVPVLVTADRELCHYFLDETMLIRHLEAGDP
ncbi:MAG: thioredoxin family protein [Chromatiales bacterium 21-64-14]|nr:MAG: thioredoxin family protein [Chromatiales bacterium 21-64-14]HQU15960.1 glutaredoxin family protein [Gammaproteobacteria bacterium]